ncbi:MAG TPA: helix-turn-helix domain-containing protein [Solirubrobacterales bacterium]|nr:helix-turn-helix domain-containing protein [Solirubrobacterales bacterium]
MTRSRKGSSTSQLLTALGSPLRRRILRGMEGDPTSPGKLAESMGVPLSTVSYHVRILDRCAALELVKEKPVRGAIEHFYRSAVTAKWARMALEESRAEDGD